MKVRILQLAGTAENRDISRLEGGKGGRGKGGGIARNHCCQVPSILKETVYGLLTRVQISHKKMSVWNHCVAETDPPGILNGWIDFYGPGSEGSSFIFIRSGGSSFIFIRSGGSSFIFIRFEHFFRVRTLDALYEC